MLHGLSDSLRCWCFQISLVDRVTDDEHVICTDADQEELHELMHACGLATEVETKTKTGKVSKNDAQEAHQGNDETAVHCADRSKNDDCVDGDKNDGNRKHTDVILEIRGEGISDATLCEQLEGYVFRTLV